MSVPVADDEAVKSHALLQHFGKQVPATVYLLAAPTVERCHDRLRTGFQCRHVPLGMNVQQLLLGGEIVSPIDPLVGAAVADEVLGGSDEMGCIQKLRGASVSLQPGDHSAAVLPHDFGIFRVALVGAAPPVVSNDGQRRCKRPVDSRRSNFQRGGFADSLDQVRVSGSAQRDVLREQRGTNHVIVTVHRIRPPDHRNRGRAAGGIHRRIVEFVGHREPIRDARCLDAPRKRAAAIQNRSKVILLDVRRRDVLDFRLYHLSDLLLERHLRQHGRDVLLQRLIECDGTGDPGPIHGSLLPRLAAAGNERRQANQCRAPKVIE